MTIERITKEKLDKIKDLIRNLDESSRKNYGPGKFFTNETIVNGDKLNVLTALVKNLMVDAEKLQKTMDMYINFIAEKLPNETITFDPNKKKLYIPEKKPTNTPTKYKAPKPTNQVSKQDVENDNGIDMLLLQKINQISLKFSEAFLYYKRI